MSIDKLPKIEHALNCTIEIAQSHKLKNASEYGVQAWLSCGDCVALEGDYSDTIIGALESLLQKFEEIGR